MPCLSSTGAITARNRSKLIDMRSDEILTEKILTALLTEKSVAAAARAVPCATSTIYERLKDTEFKDRLSGELKARRIGTRVAGQQAVTAAVSTLNDTLASPVNATTSDRLRAADIVLKYFWD